ncbi:hypothetical protein ACP6H1_27315 [Vibrio harveyi]|uniref:hypothetical protein n=1 Tax=Vibrio harveyi TaxID=669 RepID=UPI003CEEAB85
MATEYRTGKTRIYDCFLNESEADTVQKAVELAAKKTGVTNNRKARVALVEMAQHYINTNSGEQ